MIYIGIDPGKSGGIAVGYRTPDGHLDDVVCWNMPETPADLLELLERYDPRRSSTSRAVLERVNAGVWGHVAGGGAKRGSMGVSSAFTFGRGYGWIEMALLAARIPVDLVQPVTWQTALGCRTRGDKNVSKARAQQLFPSIKITHAIADALLLMEYARRSDRGQPAATRNGGTDGKEEGSEAKGRQAGKGQGKGARTAHAQDGAAQSDTPRHGAGSDRSAR